VADDELEDLQAYICVLSNELLRSLVQGEDQRIVPPRVTGAWPAGRACMLTSLERRRY